MANKQLIDFIREQTARGVKKEIITKTLLEMPLLGAKYTSEDIEEGFRLSNQSLNMPIGPTMQELAGRNKHKWLKRIIVLFVIIIFIPLLFKFLIYNPILETCRETNSFAFDSMSGNYLKYVECMRGYTITKFPDGGYSLINHVVNGYIEYDKNNKLTSKILNENQYSGEFRRAPVLFFPGTGLFLTNGLLNYQNGKINNVDINIPFNIFNIIAIKNYDIYYVEKENFIKKENVLSGQISNIIDLSSLERHNLYNMLYDKAVLDINGSLVMMFNIRTIQNKEEYYSLDLDTGKLNLLDAKPNISNPGPYNIDPYYINYEISEQKAEDYGLGYDSNIFGTITYKIILFIKGGTKHSPLESIAL